MPSWSRSAAYAYKSASGSRPAGDCLHRRQRPAQDYKAVGDTVGLGARMEQRRHPGLSSTAQTYRQVAGYEQCDNLGLASVKGKAAKMRVYRVTGERGTLSRLDVAREHGLTRLVGREQELALLREGFARVKDGYGQALSIIGEAGLGKSRLPNEFLQALAGEESTLSGGPP